MTIILALETSTEIASVALLHEAELTSAELSGVNTHSHGLIPVIQELLLAQQLNIQQLNLIAFGCGPGAFTGVRTACGVVQGLSFGLDLPIVAVNSLHSQAQAALEQFSLEDCVCVLDARMGEVYWAHLKHSDGQWLEVSLPRLSRLEDAVLYASREAAALVCGTQLDLGANSKWYSAMPHACYSVKIAAAITSSNYQAPEHAQPVYLRNKVALTTAERMLAKAE